MKTKGYVPIVCVAVVCVTVALLRVVPRTVPYEQCSEVYRKYAGVEGVRASFVKDFWLNDSVAVDVTLLEADSDEGWERLIDDFKIIPYDKEDSALVNPNAITLLYVKKDDSIIGKGGNDESNDMLMVSQHKRTVSFFDIRNEEQENAIFMYSINMVQK